MEINKERKRERERNMLDILVDPKKVEEIAVLPTASAVEKKLKEEGIDATSEDVKVLKNVFEAAANKLDESELEKVGGGIDWKSAKAKKAYGIIGGVVGATAILSGAGLGLYYLINKKGQETKEPKKVGSKDDIKLQNFE